MITLRRNTERRHINNGKYDSWLTFYNQKPPHSPSDAFGILTAFNEIRIPVHAGEFQHMTVGRGIRHKETNPSLTDWAHVFRIYLHPSEVGVDCVHEQKRFPGAQRHNQLCIVASPDGRKGSLRILQDALGYSSIIDPGHHLIHELLPGRSAWVHVIDGEATLHDIILTQGDGAGVTIEPSVSVTAQENTEMLLVDVGPTPGSLAETGW
jgi:redox-sensitive bicupin YhaK (pirin superfamily)